MPTQPPDITAWNLSSISGIILVTFALMEVLKAYVKPTTPIMGKAPTWLTTIVIAEILAALANMVIKPYGKPLLPGDHWAVLWQAFLGAGSASGFFSMIKNRYATIGCAQPLSAPPKPEGSPIVVHGPDQKLQIIDPKPKETAHDPKTTILGGGSSCGTGGLPKSDKSHHAADWNK